MTALHELLAVEKTRTSQAVKLLKETLAKFSKAQQYFQGYDKSLRMIVDSPENTAIENAARESVALTTTVPETLSYVMEHWVKAEDVIYQINDSNRSATADLYFRGEVIAKQVPVDELMGLETRLTTLRGVLVEMPTLAATSKWELMTSSDKEGVWVIESDETTVKTEKVMTPVVLAPATDKHPAQIEKVVVDKPVGTFSIVKYSGAATSAQKAAVLGNIDDLLVEVKAARMRANQVEVSKGKIGQVLADIILKPFKE